LEDKALTSSRTLINVATVVVTKRRKQRLQPWWSSKWYEDIELAMQVFLLLQTPLILDEW